MSEEKQTNTPQTPNFDGEKMKMPENSQAQHSEEEHTSSATGPIIIILAALLLIILGGLYLWFTALNTDTSPAVEETPIDRPTIEENNEPESTTAEARTENLETVSTSDEITAIEADLEATDLDALDAELEAIEAELNAAI